MAFSKILVPVDLTDKTSQAIEVAGELVAAEGEVVLLHVIEELDAPFEKMANFYEKLQADVQTRMEKHVERLGLNGVKARGTVRIGNRPREITRFSQANDFDLMILYSHRLDPVDLTHSVMTISHQVAIAAPCPVLLLR